MSDPIAPARQSSVIVCSRNRRQLLRDCVASVLDGDALPTELIVVDDSDEPDELLPELGHGRGCDLRYYWRQARGLSSALNFALRHARHDTLLFIQDDAVADPAWLSSLLRALSEAGPRAIVTGMVAPGEAETAGAFVSAVSPRSERVVFREPTPRDVLYALNMAMPRSVVEEVGPFDERLGPGTHFPASEDSDFALRALERGIAIVYDPRPAVRHRAWRGEEMLTRFRFGYGFARGGFYAKHIRLGHPYALRRLARDVWDHSLPALGRLRRDRAEALGDLALAAGVIAGAVSWTLRYRFPAVARNREEA